MSKFLLNLLLQISKALVYSKNQILFGKEFFSHFGPSFGLRPSHGPSPLSFPNWLILFPSPLGIGHSAARSAQLATRWWRPAR
jgi:hypothetical protein